MVRGEPTIGEAVEEGPSPPLLKELRRLHELYAELSAETDLMSALNKLLRAAVSFVGTSRGCVQLVPPDDETRLDMVVAVGYPPANTFVEHFRHQGAKAVCEAARANGHHLIIDDLLNFPPLAGTADLQVGLENNIRATLNVPMVSHQGRTVGVLNAQFPVPHRPTDDQVRIFEMLAWTAADFVERHAAEKALRDSAERFRALATASTYVLYSMSADWSQMRHLDGRGFLSNTVEPQNDWLQKYILPEDHPMVLASIAQAIRTKTMFTLEHRVLRADGSIGWTSSRAVPLLDSRGGVCEWFVAASDVSERKKAEAELERSNCELSTFAHTAAHDLQSPVFVIKAYTELLRRRLDGQLDSSTLDLMNSITAGAKQMEALIEDLLHYARVGQNELEPTTFSTAAVLSEVLENLGAQVQEQSATVTHDALPEIWGDRVQVVQLLQNLIGNGIKYGRPGVTPLIEITAAPQGSMWLFAVKDNGEGISHEYREEIFKPFKRLHGSAVPGTGLGLAVCRRVVERHGGCIWVDSTPGEGSIFYFTLPNAPQ